MSEEKAEVIADGGQRRKLAYVNNGDMPEGVKSCYALVSHRELDNLVGRLMQMCELTGDQEQRRALKDEIKQRCRSWLDDLYEDSGYDRFTGIKESANVIE